MRNRVLLALALVVAWGVAAVALARDEDDAPRARESPPRQAAPPAGRGRPPRPSPPADRARPPRPGRAGVVDAARRVGARGRARRARAPRPGAPAAVRPTRTAACVDRARPGTRSRSTRWSPPRMPMRRCCLRARGAPSRRSGAREAVLSRTGAELRARRTRRRADPGGRHARARRGRRRRRPPERRRDAARPRRRRASRRAPRICSSAWRARFASDVRREFRGERVRVVAAALRPRAYRAAGSRGRPSSSSASARSRSACPTGATG